MKEFMMIFRNERPEGPAPTAEQMQEKMKQWQSWIKGIAAKGSFTGTNRLYPEGKTVNADKVIMDGPFAEAKEIVGGYLVVKAGSLDEAVEMAKSCPGLSYCGNVEVRAVMPIDDDVNSNSFLQEQTIT